MMYSNENRNNDVNGTETVAGEGASSGRCPVAEQRRPDRHPTTAGPTRTNWTKELNKLVMRCYLFDDPTKRGFRKRM